MDTTVSGEAIRQAALTLATGEQRGHTYILQGGVATLGRSKSNDIVLADETVSRCHCRVYWAENGYVLEDLDSSNGTYLNGERIHRAMLYSGDALQIGDQVLDFTFVS